VPFHVVPIEGTLMERTANLLVYSHDAAPRTRAVVRDSTEWPSIWRMVADTVPPPEVHFGDDGLILVATRGRLRSTGTITITSVRRCRSTGALVVTSVERGPGNGFTDMPDRGMSMVQVSRRELTHRKVFFRDLYVKR
jgi:hypothetical protein